MPAGTMGTALPIVDANGDPEAMRLNENCTGNQMAKMNTYIDDPISALNATKRSTRPEVARSSTMSRPLYASPVAGLTSKLTG